MVKLLLFLVLFSTKATAGYFDLNLGSYHYMRNTFDNDVNERNYGAGYTGDGFTAGFYENSDNRTSVYLGRLHEKRNRNVALGIAYGLVSGYDKDATLFVTPYFAYGTKVRSRIIFTHKILGLSLQFQM